MKIDFSKFKKVHEDHSHAVLQHPEGHQIRIAKDKLSKGLKSQLASLPQHFADGGEVAPSSNEPWDPSTLRSFTEPPKPGEPWQVGDGGYRPDPALINQGGSRSPASWTDADSQKALADAQARKAEQSAGIGEMFSKAWHSLSNPVNEGLSSVNPNQTIFGGFSASPIQSAEAAPTQTQAGGTQSTPSNYALQGPAPAAAKSPTGAASPLTSAYDQYGNMLNKGIKESKQGFQAEYEANKQLGQLEQGVASNEVTSIQGFQKQAQDNWNNYNQERQHLLNDIQQGHIDTHHYFESKSVPAKISTAIGLILGGIGGALTGQENPALKFLNQQIDRDIEAQKADMGKRETLLAANFKHFGNMQDALSMTRVMQNDIYSAKLKEAAAKTQDQMAKAALMKASGDIDMRSAPLLQQVTMNKTMMQALSQSQSNPDQFLNTLRMVAPDKAKEIEGRYIPSVGIASVPLSEEARKQIIGRSDLQEQVRKVRSWAQEHSGTMSPEEISYGRAMASQLQDAYRRANDQGVFKDSEAHFVKGIVEEDPTKFFNSWRVDPKYKALEDANGATLNHIKRSYGLPESNYAAQPMKNVPKGYKKKG